MNSTKELPLRIGVGIILLNNKNKVFVGERIDNPGSHWQMPQGGVDENENLLEAAKRELREETKIKSTILVKEIDGWLTYNLPKNLLGKIWNGKYRGQKQKWFIMKFLGKEDEIDINTKDAEFLRWKWIDISHLPKVVVNFKLDIYKKLVDEIKSLKIV